MSVALALAVALVLTTDEAPQSPCAAPSNPLVRAYSMCVVETAVKLEASGESASDVATAAVVSCGAAKNALLDSAKPCLSSDDLSKGADWIDDQVRKLAIDVVVKMRADRHYPAK